MRSENAEDKQESFSRLHCGISIFIVFHLLSISFSALNQTVRMPLIPPLAQYVNLFGLYQNWVMFATAPSANNYLCAVLLMDNGVKKFVEFPRMDKLNRANRVQLHRFRKFQQSNIFNPAYALLYPQLCRWIINGQGEEAQVHVREVTLFRKELSLFSNEEKMQSVFRYKVN